MTPCLILIFLFINCLSRTELFGQAIENKIIEKSKGTWITPIPKYLKIEGNKERERRTIYDKTDSSLTFVTDSSYSVTAVFGGKVVAVFPIEDAYMIMTQFGDYFISYTNLTDVKVKEGDLIKEGSLIGKVMKVDEDYYFINFILMKKKEMIGAQKWFKW